jgi:hypothetical protein
MSIIIILLVVLLLSLSLTNGITGYYTMYPTCDECPGLPENDECPGLPENDKYLRIEYPTSGPGSHMQCMEIDNSWRPRINEQELLKKDGSRYEFSSRDDCSKSDFDDTQGGKFKNLEIYNHKDAKIKLMSNHKPLKDNEILNNAIKNFSCTKVNGKWNPILLDNMSRIPILKNDRSKHDFNTAGQCTKFIENELDQFKGYATRFVLPIKTRKLPFKYTISGRMIEAEEKK